MTNWTRCTRVSIALLLLVLAACAAKPTVEPPAGTWSGDYGATADSRDPITVELRWESNELRGIVRPGTRTIPVSKASFAPTTGAITIEFDSVGAGGLPVHYVVDGKVAGDTMTGSWTRGEQHGDFHVTRE